MPKNTAHNASSYFQGPPSAERSSPYTQQPSEPEGDVHWHTGHIPVNEDPDEHDEVVHERTHDVRNRLVSPTNAAYSEERGDASAGRGDVPGDQNVNRSAPGRDAPSGVLNGQAFMGSVAPEHGAGIRAENPQSMPALATTYPLYYHEPTATTGGFRTTGYGSQPAWTQTQHVLPPPQGAYTHPTSYTHAHTYQPYSYTIRQPIPPPPNLYHTNYAPAALNHGKASNTQHQPTLHVTPASSKTASATLIHEALALPASMTTAPSSLTADEYASIQSLLMHYTKMFHANAGKLELRVANWHDKWRSMIRVLQASGLDSLVDPRIAVPTSAKGQETRRQLDSSGSSHFFEGT